MIVKTSLRSILIPVAAVMAYPACAATPKTVPTDLVTHNEVVINAAPAKIWPHIVDPNAWKRTGKRVSVDGEPGKAGEKFKVVAKDNPQEVLYYVENVEMVEQRRRTIRITATDGTLIGYSSWSLVPQGGKTAVRYDVYCFDAVPIEKADASPAEIAAAKKSYFDDNYRRFDAEFAVLKKLVEAHP